MSERAPAISKDWKRKMTLEYKDDADRSRVLPKVALPRSLAERFEGEVALSCMHADRCDGQESGVGDDRLHTNPGVNWYSGRAFEIQALVGRSLRHPGDRDAYKSRFAVEYKFDGTG